jgi:hypothetical protein
LSLIKGEGKERERRETVGEVVGVITFEEGVQGTMSRTLKVPRQCPFVLLVNVMHVVGINFT